jgi:hypothetical protein
MRSGARNAEENRMRLTTWLVAGLALLASAACLQKADWIQGTLVTVDVTGVWRGSGGPTRGLQGELEMTLSQRGAKVVGTGRYRATKMTVDGAVRGDVFSFRDAGGLLHGETTVTGDEMSGLGWTGMGTGFGEFRIRLSRQP